MAFWKREADPEVEAARAAAEAALPGGWKIHVSDLETFSVPAGRVETYGVSAGGPGGEAALVIAVGEAEAYRQFVRHMRGELPVTDGWAVRLDRVKPKSTRPTLEPIAKDDVMLATARREVEDSLPAGWSLFYSDRERYRFPSGNLEVYGLSAAGPTGEGELVLGVGHLGAYIQMARRLRGELDTTIAWAPTLSGI